MLPIRLGKRASELCVAVKRQTGLRHMNEVCRLAFFQSLVRQQSEITEHHDGNGSIDIEWGIFAGPYAPIIRACAIADLGLGEINDTSIRNRIVNRISNGLMTLDQTGNVLSVASKL